MSKVIDAKKAAALIKDNDTIAFNGFAFGFGFPEALAKAIEERYIRQQTPKNLTLLFASGCGDSGKSDFGLDHFAHDGMVQKIIGGHMGLAKKLSQMIYENKVEAYNFPQGVITHLYREIAGGKQGVITHVGLKTFADPRMEGGKMNNRTVNNLVELITVNGTEQLFYHTIPIQIALIRGTKIDEEGNMTLQKEGVYLETLHIAQATKNSGGIVIAQAEQIAKSGSLNVREIEIPGILVDYVVQANPQEHKMNCGVLYDPSYTGEVTIPVASIRRMSMNIRKVISKRCAMELEKNTIINLGIGIPEGVARIALEEGISDWTTMTIEAGSIGGIPGSGTNLGGATNVESIIGHANMFDFYDGGGLDIAFLGLAQTDKNGNINVSKFNGKMMGCGGFVNITQNTPKVIFCGTFMAGKTEIEIKNGTLHIIKEGTFKKFVSEVEQITFSGEYAKQSNQTVLYITERAVFQLTKKGIKLIEIAPGIDLQTDVLNNMDFKPIISDNLKIMDQRIFIDSVIGLKDNANKR